MKKGLLSLVVLCTLALQPADAINLELRFDRLQEAFRLLPEADRGTVDEIIVLLKRGSHKEALTRLEELNQQFPSNSSLRVLTAYALLNLGNVLGAFEEADRAHDAPNGNPYKCLFFSKVALLAGRHEACKRELEHARQNKEQPKEVREIEMALSRKQR
jgi:Flp pilus assembly protein TadD